MGHFSPSEKQLKR